ncbi:MAG: bifunctional adenosylcobinamide kinase/adenosylcobinamide-phosphate guanylyltransferase [Oscillospiraceae bacterium]|nr:bifunctional adenosylcobinamide kinase/adenosylcobinamide-phosphate guanylyltransferase [Oscillospiraceae bacterium]
MDLIIGGAYQGKLDLAKDKYDLEDSDIYFCTEESCIEFGKKCLYHAEEFSLWCVRNGMEATELLDKHKEEWKDSLFICEDIFCGVVPIGEDMRAWREMTGRMCAYLSSKAKNVCRVFCGLEQKLK